MSAAAPRADLEALAARHAHLLEPGPWRRFRVPLVVAALGLYALFCVRFFDIDDTLERADWSIAGSYLADWVSWESRPDVEFEDGGALDVRFPRFDAGGSADELPEWLTTTSDGASSDAPTRARVAMGSSGSVSITASRVTLAREDRTLELDILPDGSVVPDGPLPDWATQRAPGAKVIARFGVPGRVEVEGDEVKVRRRFVGWENFLFDEVSVLNGLTVGQLARLMVSPERLDPARSNLALAWHEILHNAEWQHLDVWTKLLQTIVMAFVGTLFAMIVAFPVSFLAARNIARSRPLNHLVSRAFDFLRSVDMLIWALFFTRAFGPGPLAGIAAIFLTDTGTLGKLYAEALENIDEAQREGATSLGASAVAVQRFAVVPQVLPVFLGQALYFLESNVRSATIIGAVGAGGIGLKLWEAMRTNQDWENVAYMVVLILVVVYCIDHLSGALRARLAGEHPGDG